MKPKHRGPGRHVSRALVGAYVTVLAIAAVAATGTGGPQVYTAEIDGIIHPVAAE
jgi:hypothetical protein